ncbi:hypothetical protein BDR04DRAFT_1231463 [Suillus decipiens]|nr:hypothetical protein BDR04DRAFT_1231463 [Suillus decipiens]
MSLTPSSSSPVPFAMSSAPASTAASSPPPSEGGLSSVHKNTRESSETLESIEEEEFRERFSRLQRLLEKSFTYSKLLGAQMDKEKRACALRAAMQAAAPSKPESSRRRVPKRGKKRSRVEEVDEEAPPVKPQIQEPPVVEGQRPKFPQPALVTGAKLKDYQLEGVEWMVSLDKNGVSGILADEMGLGKTLQTIAFNAHLRGLGHYQPFLIVCPLSVLHNWIEEFQKFAPTIPVCMYHGTPAERADLRRTIMRPPDVTEAADEEVMIKTQRSRKGKSKKAPAHKAPAPKRTKNSRPTKRRKVDVDEQDSIRTDEEDENSDVEDTRIPTTSNTLSPQTRASFPVIVTTYEMILKDRVHLSAYNWGYIVVDEGHRLKNLDCKLMQEIKKYPSAGRMILTGTPLHNNLAELWSLLNFILPDIFDDLDTFQEWFNLGTMQSRLSEGQSSQLIGTLHGILKPFLLRRLKADVEGLLPPKKEYVLYAPLSVSQRNLYDNILDGSLRNFLLGVSKEAAAVEKVAEVDMDAPMKLRKQKKMRYDLYGNDDKYFKMLEDGGEAKAKETKEDIFELARHHQQLATRKQINNMKLQSAVMQLRKVCSHPFLFHWPVVPGTQELVLDEQLVNASGKMMVLDRLLDELFRRKHKVLLFSQFTTMLDVLEDWATELKGWSICRIDGSTAPMERREQMNKFQQGGDSRDAPKLFLLSTRAGGLGINLTAADTVIFYDQDWNPQMDIQAQDRAHRIGQTKPVLVFRLVTAHTIETRIMHRATEKRKLEALVIAKGKFKLPGQGPSKSNPQSMTELAADLLKLEGEQIDVVTNTSAEGKKRVLSDEDLNMLLDRSEAVFTDRKKGWKSEESGAGKRAAFAVYEAPVHEGNDLVAKIMGEDVPEC